MKYSTTCLAVAVITLAAGCQSPKRTFRFEYTTKISGFASSAKLARVWVPVPQSDEAQDISNVEVSGVADYEITTEPVYGNQMVYFDLAAPLPREVELKVAFDVVRREVTEVGKLRDDPLKTDLLEGDRMAPLTDEVRKRSGEATAGGTLVPAMARGIYDRVLDDVDYDKSGQGWGRGDIEYVCDIGKGNCSDFHTLFIGMARAKEIPSVFEIGFPLPEGKAAGTIGGYHCWAWYRDGEVWKPVDASEADKAPEKTEYFFGTICENRVALTLGRDLVLSPPQHGEPINFFIYPYVEVDQEPGGATISKSFRFEESS